MGEAELVIDHQKYIQPKKTTYCLTFWRTAEVCVSFFLSGLVSLLCDFIIALHSWITFVQ